MNKCSAKLSSLQPQIFAKLLDGEGGLHDFLWNFRKCLSASIKFTKLLLDLFANKENCVGGVFEKSHCPCRHRANTGAMASAAVAVSSPCSSRRALPLRG